MIGVSARIVLKRSLHLLQRPSLPYLHPSAERRAAGGPKAHLMGVAADGDAEAAAQAQVRDLEAHVVGVHQQILWL